MDTIEQKIASVLLYGIVVIISGLWVVYVTG